MACYRVSFTFKERRYQRRDSVYVQSGRDALKEGAVAYCTYYLCICSEGLKRTTKEVSQDSGCDPDTNVEAD
jgi:hypothetical protein